jgi:hypothetical protein
MILFKHHVGPWFVPAFPRQRGFSAYFLIGQVYRVHVPAWGSGLSTVLYWPRNLSLLLSRLRTVSGDTGVGMRSLQ